MSLPRARGLVAIAAALALAVKLALALTTFGTNDMLHWLDFAAGVRRAGPVGIYGLSFPHSFYNHAPLTGYLLWFLNGLADLGLRLNVSLRVLSSLADVGTAFVVLELTRRRAPLPAATVAALGVALSPILILISGFHGNTDPIYIGLTLGAVWLFADRRAPLAAGLVLGLALSIKIVPIVVVPALLVAAARAGRGPLIRVLAGLAVAALVWLPPLITHFGPLRSHVFGYGGGDNGHWGLGELARLIGGQTAVELLAGPVRFVVVAVCALGPAVLVARRPGRFVGAAGLSLVGFLTLSTGFGTQYLVWATAAGYLLSTGLATAFNLAGGIFIFMTYNSWAGGLPWDRAYWHPMTGTQQVVGLIAWVLVLLTAVVGGRRLVADRLAPRAGRANDQDKPVVSARA